MTKEQRAETYAKDRTDHFQSGIEKRTYFDAYAEAFEAGFTASVELCAEIAESEAMPKMSRQRSPVAEYIRDEIKKLDSGGEG